MKKTLLACREVLALVAVLLWIGSLASVAPAAPPGTEGASPAASSPGSAPAPNAPKVEELPQKDSLTQYGITWTFDKKVPVGQFVNGDYYVVGPVTVVSVSPKPENNKNGSELNPATGSQQGYGEQKGGYAQTLVYDPKLSAQYPLEMKPGDSLVSTISFGDKDKRPPVYKYGTSASITRTAAVVTCLEAPVPADTFRPSYCGHQGRLYRYGQLHTDLLLSLKPPLDKAPPVPPPATNPSARVKQLEDLFPEMDDYANLFSRPWIDHIYGWGTREIHPADSMPDYGQGVAQAVSEASLLLLSDYPLEKRKKLLIGFVQYGIDLYGAIERGCKGWPQQGGFGAGRKWPILFAGILFADDKMQHPKAEFAEDQGTMLDECWTGANAVFTGHSGRDGMGDPERGEYEHLYPSLWPGTESESYRRCCNSHSWVGFALAARLMHAEKLWDHEAFFAYVDRWMMENDEAIIKEIETAYKARGWDAKWMWGTWARQGRSWEPYVTAMWEKYRTAPGMAPSSFKKAETIRTGDVQIDERGAFVVDGKPFFPLMLVDQTPDQIELAKGLGINTFFGNGWKWPSGIAKSNKEFLDKLAAAGMYGVLGADARMAGNPHLLGWLQWDQPDKVKTILDADVTTDRPDRGDKNDPPSRLVDGDTKPGRGAVLGPIEGMELTIHVKKPVTASALAIWIDAKGSATTPKEVVFLADGKEVLKATLEKKDGQQKFDLKEPTTFSALTFKSISAYPAEQKWGRIDEIQALDKDGKPIRLSNERYVPMIPPEYLPDVYQWCKGRDESKPVFVEFAWTQGIAPFWDPNVAAKLYGDYLKSSDVAGIPDSGRGLGGDLEKFRKLTEPNRPWCAFIHVSDSQGFLPAMLASTQAALVRKMDAMALGQDLKLRAIAWDAIIGGADAIGYRPTNVGKNGPVLSDNAKAEIKRLNEQITRLAPFILAPPPRAKMEFTLAGAKGQMKATELNGEMTIFAQITDWPEGRKAAAIKGTIKVAGLKAGTRIEVVDENRTITAEDGQFSDEFTPWAEHVYKIAMR